MTISEYEDGHWDDDEWEEWDDDADFYADEELLARDWDDDAYGDALLIPDRPARFYECRECDGMGRDPYYNECERCRGTGARWGWLGWLRVLRGFITLRVYRCLCGKINAVFIFGKMINRAHECKWNDEIPF